MTMDRQRGRAPLMRSVVRSLALALALTSAGCREHLRVDDATAGQLNDPDKRHPIAFTKRTEALYVEVAQTGDGLSPNQQADVWRFLERYKSESAGPLQISAPGSVKGHISVSRSVRHVEEMVAGAGIPQSAVEERRHHGSTEFGRAVKLAYERPVAMAPECGSWPEDLGENRERVPNENFGCASQRNLAMMVANARDLKVPQEETSRSGERRDVVWTKYVGAEKSGSKGGGAPTTGSGGGGVGQPLRQ